MGKNILISCLVLIFSLGVCQAESRKPRYISLAPSTTEILFALGLGDDIVGVSSYCDYPPEAKEKEKVGTFIQPNIEKIVFLKPDYIFCTGLKQAPAVSALKRLGLKVYVSDPSSISELLSSINDIGDITGKTKEAESLTSNMQRQIEEISSKVSLVPTAKRTKVFIEIWHDPLTTAGIGSFVDGLLTLAGGVNIANDTKSAYSIFSPEEVIKRDPDCIIITYMDKRNALASMKKRFGWSGIAAVKNNRVYDDIDSNLLLRPGPRIVEGLKEIQKRLYP
jgi:iron complex transport system substrate-binding protein